ncbi:spondin-1 isoform X2 [Athalia rosae]|uniref:spondin-1 isoform X2 n=1 Tax=Athalia rosae TaxID=37344 RepID=UPI00203485EF|nr:spondin-1 isoform X2 [Athalia rosae]
MVVREVRILLMLLAAVVIQVAGKCDRKPEDSLKPRSPLGGKFRIVVSEYNKTEYTSSYIPNTKYIVSLQGDKSGMISQKFGRFTLVAENRDDESADIGYFEIEDSSFTKFSDKCPNAVIEASKIPKEEVTVAWMSPMEDAGCILIRATVVESRETWYMDEGGLTVTLCQFSASEIDDPGPVLSTCCACDEAKYEVTFEGLWSRNTHPKDFPSNGWLTRFSDVIGASHTVDYRFWEYAEVASEGLKQVAERGATRMLESELKDESEHIRTIIKARGISYPNVTGRTFAVFRVDRKHHLMSLVSMIDPSPDWIVGVSGLELCLSNCSWIEHKELNLYPYDAGTDSGITYISPDSPTIPREPIRRITSTFPHDNRSPFYDESGIDMKPIAKLYLNRQRLYEKTCDDPQPVVGPTEACEVSGWSKFGECSRSCGRGHKLRQRHYIDPEAASASNCKRELTGRTKCNVERCPGHSTRPGLTAEMCELEEWTAWSSCTTTCGAGLKTRSRKYKNRKYRKYCMHNVHPLELEQTIECDENEPCSDDDPDAEEVSETTETAVDEDENEHENENNNNDNDSDNDNENENENDNENENENEHENENETEYIEEVTRSEEWLQKCPRERFTEWSMWSPCSSSCGPGVRLRSRLPNKSWSHMNDAEERDLEECKIEQASCEAEIPNCDFSEEIARSICSEPQVVGTCNGNILRVYFDSASNQCRWFGYTGCNGNRNNFPTEQDCNNVCSRYQRELRANLSAVMKKFKVSLSSVLSYHIPTQEQRSGKTKRAKYAQVTEEPDLGGIPSGSQVIETTDEYSSDSIDCEFTEWGSWSPCRSDCKGYTYRNRTIIREAENGGRKCPTKLQQKKRCRKVPPCSTRRGMRRRSYNDSFYGSSEDPNPIDCEVSSWSPWSPCTATCGYSVRHRTRNIMVVPVGQEAKLCPSLVQFASCSSPACTETPNQ